MSPVSLFDSSLSSMELSLTRSAHGSRVPLTRSALLTTVGTVARVLSRRHVG